MGMVGSSSPGAREGPAPLAGGHGSDGPLLARRGRRTPPGGSVVVSSLWLEHVRILEHRFTPSEYPVSACYDLTRYFIQSQRDLFVIERLLKIKH